MEAHFIQVADIDMNVAPFNQNSGWDPIGTNGSGNEFSGTMMEMVSKFQTSL